MTEVNNSDLWKTAKFAREMSKMFLALAENLEGRIKIPQVPEDAKKPQS